MFSEQSQFSVAVVLKRAPCLWVWSFFVVVGSSLNSLNFH